MASSNTVNYTQLGTTGPQGPQGNQGPVGIQGNPGIRGAIGSNGPKGSSGQITSVSATTLPEGQAATVSNTGTTVSAILAFGIPKGDTGDTGPVPTLNIGTFQASPPTGTVPNQSYGAASSTFSSGGTDIYNLNLVLPTGLTGATGPPITVGAVSTTTIDPPGVAAVTITPAGATYDFAFVIPKGNTGSIEEIGSDLEPDITNLWSLGTTAKFFKDGYFSGNLVFSKTNNLTLSVSTQATGIATLSIPDLGGNGGNIVIDNLAQTLTNKTLTTPQINDTTSDHQYVFASSELVADRTVTLPLLTGNDEFVFNDHAQTLTNKTLTTPQINDTTSDHQYVFASSELVADRTVTLPLLTGDDEFVFKDHIQTLTNKTLTTPQINDTTSDHQYVFASSELVDDRTVTLPLLTGNDEFVFKDHAQTLTNKTLTAPKFGSAGKIDDASGNELIKFPGVVVNATNEITISNAVNGSGPSISATGSSDADIHLNLIAKGTGNIKFTTNSNIGTLIFNAASKTLTVGSDLTTSGTNTTITGAGQANTLTLNEGFTIGNGNIGTLTFGAASKTLTVSANCTIDQNLASGQIVAFNGLSIPNVAATTTNVVSITGNALTTGSALNVTSNSADKTSGGLVNIAQTGATTTQEAPTLTVSTSATTNSGAGVASFTGNALTTGDAVSISATSLSGGNALKITGKANETALNVAAGNATFGGDVTVNGGDITLGKAQDGTLSVEATDSGTNGKNLTITAGGVSGGNGDGGDLILQAGAASGSGAEGKLKLRASGVTYEMPSSDGTSGQALTTDAAGVLTWTTPTANGASTTTKVKVSVNNTTNENNLITFVADAATSTGQQNLEMDSDLNYNPNTGTLSATNFVGDINDTNNNELIKFPSVVANATNEITISNAVNGSAPSISATGSADANIDLNLIAKGTGNITLNGDVTVTTGKNVGMSGASTFTMGSGAVDLGTGTVAIGGDVTIAANKDILMQGSGTFTSGTGAVTLAGATGVSKCTSSFCHSNIFISSNC